jgi:transcriptional regulator of arginine metabolism
MHKAKRLLAIEKIIAGENISSQGKLLNRLNKRGIICTQATLSRDLRQMGVGRVSDGKGGYRYSLGEHQAGKETTAGKVRIFHAIRDVVDAKGMVVIKTIPGNAGSAAFFIDNASRYEIAGTIAGDDTILIIPRDGVTVNQVHACLEMILPGWHDKVKMTRK